ncbi:MAG: rod-binding protein [Hyphomonadaceae bacterium]|nr:rod-binding protein [Hyphomonadaceae bacterium]
MTDASALPGAPLPMLSRGAISTTAPPGPRADNVDPAVRRAAEEFESMFLSQMLAPMFEGLDADGLGGGGMGEEMFRPMLIEQYAKAISQAGGVGLADSIIAELNRLQAAAPTSQDPEHGADR